MTITITSVVVLFAVVCSLAYVAKGKSIMVTDESLHKGKSIIVADESLHKGKSITVADEFLSKNDDSASADDNYGYGYLDKTPTVPQMIRKAGYQCEEHTVITKDGYILTLHRIPRGKRANHWWNFVGPPVYFQHGLLSSSASWVLNSPDKAGAYIYADHGYDVWLGNIRGNKYSRKHQKLDPSGKEFWQFSWDEMAEYDLPATIDYILEYTGYSQLNYIGHSMGTTIFLAGLSINPAYNEKIKLGILLAPVATVGHIETPLRYLAYARNEILFASEAMQIYEFMPENEFFIRIIRPICNIFQVTEVVCGNMLFLVTGFDNHEFNSTMFPEITKELLSGTSIYTVVQYAQEYASGLFQYYDYGISGNQDKYEADTPPLYDLGKVTAPVILMYGHNDYLADPTDVAYLAKQLPNLKELWKVDYPNFNHLDFLWAIDAYRLVYDRMLKVMGFY